MIFLLEFFLLYGAKGLARFLCAIPRRWALSIGQTIGWIVYCFAFNRRKQVYLTLKRAFGDSRSSKELKGITRKTFLNFSRNVVDLLCLPKLPPQELKKRLHIEGEEYLDAARNLGRGVLMVSVHFGSWELYSAAAGMLEIPYRFAVKPQHRHKQLNMLLNDFRESQGAKAISTGIQTRNLIRALDRNEVIGVLIDQGGKEGYRVPFFNNQISCHSGAIRLALRKGVPIILSALIRTGKDSYRMVFHKPLHIPQSGFLKEDVFTGIEALIKGIEPYIEKYPWEYLWFYKVWKYSRKMDWLIIHDGRAGHLRQSQAVAFSAKRLAESIGWECRVHEVEIEFQSKWHRIAFELWNGILFPLSGDPHLRMLKLFLKQDSWYALKTITPDWVISCGSGIAGMNVYLKKALNANNMAVQKTGLQPIRNFHTVFLPQHDVHKNSKLVRVVPTLGAPNLINSDYLRVQKERFVERFSHLKNSSRPYIGLFIGGDSKEIFISESQVRILANQLKGICAEFKIDLMVTSSRRTPTRLEKILHHEFRKEPSCRLLILANQNNVPEAVGGILGLSKVVIVSGDSISMVSEAAASGKTTIVFMAEDRHNLKQLDNKHRRMIENLHDQGNILSTQAQHTVQVLTQVLQGKLKTMPLRDQDIIDQRLKNVIF